MYGRAADTNETVGISIDDTAGVALSVSYILAVLALTAGTHMNLVAVLWRNFPRPELSITNSALAARFSMGSSTSKA